MKENLFNNNHYNTFMYISISLTILLIFFNIVDILDNSKLDIKNNKLTGNAVENSSLDNNNIKGEIYTEKSYLIYYLLFWFLILCILILSSIFLMPRFKDLT